MMKTLQILAAGILASGGPRLREEPPGLSGVSFGSALREGIAGGLAERPVGDEPRDPRSPAAGSPDPFGLDQPGPEALVRGPVCGAPNPGLTRPSNLSESTISVGIAGAKTTRGGGAKK